MLLQRRRVPGAVILEEAQFGLGRVVRRAWRLAADEVPGQEPRPLLTGLAGFPWRGPEIDARCLQRDPRAGYLGGGIDRHHRVVPHPACTCGIYAPREDGAVRPAYLRRARDPLVTGFVRLSGRLVADGDDYRAQRASIVGPLVLIPPARPAPAHRRRVVVEFGRYRVRRTAGRTGTPFVGWLEAVAGALERRYGVDILVPRVGEGVLP